MLKLLTYQFLHEHAAVLLQSVYRMPRSLKQLSLLLIDSVLFLVSLYAAIVLALRYPTFAPETALMRTWISLPVISCKSSSFLLAGIYRPVLHHAGLEMVSNIIKAVLLSVSLLVSLSYLLHKQEWLQPLWTVLLIDALLTLLLTIGIRLLMRQSIFRLRQFAGANQTSKRVLIYGAGAAGIQVAQALIQNEAYSIFGFVDDDLNLHHQTVQGFEVYPPRELEQLRSRKAFDLIILAIPSVNGTVKRQILDRLQSLHILVKTVPSIEEILSEEVSISALRPVSISDLLGREEVSADPSLLSLNITGKTVLVTGAGGSIGSELCRQIAQQNPQCLILYELNELALYTIDLEFAERFPDLKRVACLGSVIDRERLSSILRLHQVNTIYHAAAYKHVPLVETNPAQGILNNVYGTYVAAFAAANCEVDHFVLISTDKAVRPTSVMGASKRVAELIVQAVAEMHRNTCFTMVRFGNVLGSSGSVVPRFRQQIMAGGPITVTDPNITRYFMSIPEAARLVIQAGALATGGEVFLLDMGEPVKICDLARQMIRLSGLVPDYDIAIEYTGLRPGEKLYEELLVDINCAEATRHPRIFCAFESKLSWNLLQPKLESLFLQVRSGDTINILQALKQLVPEYQPERLASLNSTDFSNEALLQATPQSLDMVAKIRSVLERVAVKLDESLLKPATAKK